MGKLTTFDVVFSSPVGFAGHWMSGKLIVELSEAMSMKGVYIRFSGRSEVKFKVGKHMRQEEENYFNSLVILKGHGPDASGNNISLDAGKYEFPFRFQLPEQIASSYEDDMGHIRYQVKGVINKPWKFDHTVKRTFTVVGICDLNMLRDAMFPQWCKSEKTLRSISCSSGILSAWIKSDRKGYVPGEKIKLKGEITNLTSRNIHYSKISLLAYTTFRIGEIEREDQRKIVNLKRGPVDPGGKDAFNNLVVQIPPVPPSYLQGCNIIGIVYNIQLRVKISFSSSLVLAHEIIIGTVPVRRRPQPRPPRVRHQVPHRPPGAGISTAQVEDVMADLEMDFDDNQGLEMDSETGADTGFEMVELDAPPMYDEEMMAQGQRQLEGAVADEPPPPSYQECVWGRIDTRDADDNEYTHGDHHWAPSYPCYPGR